MHILDKNIFEMKNISTCIYISVLDCEYLYKSINNGKFLPILLLGEKG